MVILWLYVLFLSFYFLFFFFNFIFKLNITVLDLPNIKMNPPQSKFLLSYSKFTSSNVANHSSFPRAEGVPKT